MNRDRELSILELPCYVVSTILSYLDAKSLYHLSRVNQYFKNLIEDEWKLWVNIDVRDPPYTTEMMGYITERVSEKTKKVSIMGNNCKTPVIAVDFLQHSTLAKYLTVLALENQRLDSETLTMNSFPQTLEELSLKATYVRNSLKFFKHSFEVTSNLRVLILDECIWIQTSSLMSLSKYKKLEILSLYNCNSLDDSIPYLSLVGSFGFKALKVIDARFTELGSALLNSLYRSQTILAIYLQNITVSYKIDQLKHFLEILSSSKAHECIDANDIDEFSIGDYFNSLSDRKYFESVTDRGLVEYAAIEGLKTQVLLPKSTLYKYPYKQCTCDYKRMNGKILHSPKGSNIHKGGDNNDESKGDGGDSDDDSDGDDFNDYQNKRNQKVCQMKSKVKQLEDSRSCFDYPVIVRRRARNSLYIDTADFITSGSSRHIDGIVVVDFSNTLDLGEGNIYQQNNHNILFHRRVYVAPGGSDDNHRVHHRSQLSRRTTGNEPSCSKSVKRKASEEVLNPKRVKLSSECVSQEGTKKDQTGRVGDLLEDETEHEIKDVKEKEEREGEEDEENGEEEGEKDNGDDEEVQIYQNGPLWPIIPHDVSIVHISSSQRKELKIPLKHLSLHGFRGITDNTLDYLKNLNIELLDLTDTRVTKSGIEKYLGYNPNCRIIHEMYCVCKPQTEFQV